MYEKHIEGLNSLRKVSAFQHEHDAIDAAIELMRAAQPLDPKAEREHCDQAVALAPRSGDFLSLSSAEVSSLVMRERATVRAECYMRQARSDETFEKAWSQMHYQYGEDALEQVRLGWEMAESRRLAANAALVRSAKELSAAHAKTEELKTALQDFEADTACEDRCEELETKLANLRAAAALAEQFLALSDSDYLQDRRRKTHTALVRAIEASK